MFLGTSQIRTTLPTRSLSFNGSSQYLSMSDANFGSFDRAKFSLSIWLNRDVDNVGQGIFSQYTSGPTGAGFLISYTSSNQLRFQTIRSNSVDGEIRTAADAAGTATNDTHLLLHFDSANSTATNRMRLWVNGSEVTSFVTDTAPSGGIDNSSQDINLGRGSGVYMDGLIYQYAFYSGYLVPIADVYSSGKKAVPTTGLYSGLFTNITDPLTYDFVRSANWTNNGTVTKSASVPS